MPSDKPHERTLERRNALQVIYQGDILNTKPASLIDDGCLADETQYMGDYAKQLVQGVQDNQNILDDFIVKASENWSLDRMPIVDRSLLRLATYEMKYVADVPISVSINEAVNLAKMFGGDDSPRFVNGILGRIALALQEEEHEERDD